MPNQNLNIPDFTEVFNALCSLGAQVLGMILL